MKHSAARNGSGRLWSLVLLSLIGLVVSVMQSIQFYHLRSGSASFKSYCNLGQQMNCDAVIASRYAELFAGIPLSSFAAGWMLALAIIFLLARADEWRGSALRAAALMTGFASIMSCIYLLIMATTLKTFCLNCLVMDGVNLLSFVLVLSLRPLAGKNFELGSLKSFAGITAGCLFVAVVALKGIEGDGMSSAGISERVESILAAPVVSVNAGDEFPSIGAKGAPVTIVEFSDFQCPYCRIGALTMNTILNRYPDKVRLVHRNFPLSSECNRKMERSMHPAACEAAKMTVCAQKMGKFEAVYHTLFENQAILAPGKPLELAQAEGLGKEQLAACAAAPETQAAINKDVEEALTLGLQSTPTFFINGHKVEGAFPVQVWYTVIDQLLTRP